MHARFFVSTLAILLFIPALPAAAQSAWPAGFQQQFPPVHPTAAPRTRFEEARAVRFTISAGARISMFDVSDHPRAEESAIGPVFGLGLRLSLGRFAEIDVRGAAQLAPTMKERGEDWVQVDDWYYDRYVERRHAKSYLEGGLDLLLRLYPSGGRVYVGPGARATFAAIAVDRSTTWYGHSDSGRLQADDDVEHAEGTEELFQLQGLFAAGILIGPSYEIDLGLRVAVGMMRGMEGLGFHETKGSASFELTMGVAL